MASQVDYLFYCFKNQIKSIQSFGLGLIRERMIENPWREVGCLYRNLILILLGHFSLLEAFFIAQITIVIK